MMLRSKKGFTLVELMVVAIIVAILAAVAIPLMRGSTERAIATESEAALGTIRSAMRAYYAENNTYLVRAGGVVIPRPYSVPGNVPGIRARVGVATPGDLDGRYFSEECYTITAASATTFTAECDWSNSTNAGTFTPRAADVNGSTNEAEIDELGTIDRTGY